jgi:hypothetical protein
MKRLDEWFEWDRPAPYGDGHLWSVGYKWLLSLYVFGMHIMIGRRSKF